MTRPRRLLLLSGTALALIPAPGALTATPARAAAAPATTPAATTPAATTPAATTPAATTPAATTPAAAAPAATVPAVTATTAGASGPGTTTTAAAGASSTSAAAIAVAILAGLLALMCAAWGFARWRGYEPGWAPELRHAFAEAGLRCSETWSELLDWARLRR